MPKTTTHTATVRIPTPLRAYTEEQATVEVSGATVDAVLRTLVDRFPKLKDNLFTDDDELRQFVNIYVDDEDIRYLDGPKTAVEDDTEISIVPSIAGG